MTLSDRSEDPFQSNPNEKEYNDATGSGIYPTSQVHKTPKIAPVLMTFFGISFLLVVPVFLIIKNLPSEIENDVIESNDAQMTEVTPTLSETNIVPQNYVSSQFINSHNKTSLKILSNLAQNTKENEMFSPPVLLSSLNALYNGSQGQTQEEIKNTLELKGMGLEEINLNSRTAMEIIKYPGIDKFINSSSSLWFGNSLEPDKKYLETLLNFYNIKLYSVDFSNPKTSESINDWFGLVSDGNLTYHEQIIQDTSILLLNAFTFRTVFSGGHELEQIDDSVFHNINKEEKAVQFIENEDIYKYFDGGGTTIISAPLREDDKLSMLLIISENFSKEFFEELTIIKYKDWLAKMQPLKGTVLLPKISIEYRLELSKTLQDIGIKEIFEKEADLGLINNQEKMFLSNIIHYTKFEISQDEAITGSAHGDLEYDSEPQLYKKIDSPFMFIIKNDLSEQILFTGIIRNL